MLSSLLGVKYSLINKNNKVFELSYFWKYHNFIKVKSQLISIRFYILEPMLGKVYFILIFSYGIWWDLYRDLPMNISFDTSKLHWVYYGSDLIWFTCIIILQVIPISKSIITLHICMRHCHIGNTDHNTNRCKQFI